VEMGHKILSQAAEEGSHSIYRLRIAIT